MDPHKTKSNPTTLSADVPGPHWGDATVGLGRGGRYGTTRDIAAWGLMGLPRGPRSVANVKI